VTIIKELVLGPS